MGKYLIRNDCSYTKSCASGPGGSSLLGALHEHGPCLVTEDAESTVRNELSWSNFANIVFVEYDHQPPTIFTYVN
jgi:carboxypeptidase C (cathepsin A)